MAFIQSNRFMKTTQFHKNRIQYFESNDLKFGIIELEQNRKRSLFYEEAKKVLIVLPRVHTLISLK